MTTSELSIHGVTGIKVGAVEENNGAVWRTIRITTEDDITFEVTCYPARKSFNEKKVENLNVIVITKCEVK